MRQQPLTKYKPKKIHKRKILTQKNTQKILTQKNTQKNIKPQKKNTQKKNKTKKNTQKKNKIKKIFYLLTSTMTSDYMICKYKLIIYLYL